eukprot:COSAG01_NODE_888_length_12915_cov_10.708723_7_plen_141_part_00
MPAAPAAAVTATAPLLLACWHHQPLDTIKVRLQARPGVYSGIADCAARTVRHEGVRGLFKGMVPPLVGNGPLNALLFATDAWAVRTVRVALVAGGTDCPWLRWWVSWAACGSWRGGEDGESVRSPMPSPLLPVRACRCAA